MTGRRPAIVAGLLTLAMAAAGSAAAADKATEKAWRAACRRDAFNFCTLQALAVDRAGVRACLERNIDKISEACRMVIRGGHPPQPQGQAGADQPPPQPAASSAAH
jgi:hypothetical protein